MQVRATIGAVLVAMLAACQEDERSPFEPPPSPPPIERDLRMDEPSGAMLMLPINDVGWRWLEGDALKAIAPDALLGVAREGWCEGWVTVRPHTETARAVADRVLATRRAERKVETHVDEFCLYAGHTARRWEIQGPVDGVMVSERASFIIEGPRMFAVHARARDEDYGKRRRCLDAVTAAFDVRLWEPPDPNAPKH